MHWMRMLQCIGLSVYVIPFWSRVRSCPHTLRYRFQKNAQTRSPVFGPLTFPHIGVDVLSLSSPGCLIPSATIFFRFRFVYESHCQEPPRILSYPYVIGGSCLRRVLW